MSLLNSLTPTDLNNAIPTIWDKKVRLDAARKSFWGKFIGKEGSDQPIIEKMDFTTEPGNQINIQIASQLLQEGVTGDTTLEDAEEKFTLGQMSITPNVLRHAVATNWRTKKQINFDALRMIGDLLSTWMARRTDEDLFNELVNNNPAAQLYGGNATSLVQLGQDDSFGVDEIMRGKVALQRQGALPIRTIMDGKQECDWYGCVISEIDEYQLKMDAVWNQANQNGGERGDNNRIFTGCIGKYQGVYVYTHSSVQFGGRYGSFLRPEAAVSGSLNSIATTVTVGTNANVNYTKFFPATGTLLIDSEQMTYTGKTNTTFTGVTRGANATIAASHNNLALITLNNQSKVIFFGCEIAARAWGLMPTRITDVRDYGYEQGIGIMSYYGQTAVKNSSGIFPNSLIMNTYAGNPNNV